MLITKLIKTGSTAYKALGKIFSRLDKIVSLKPELLFGFWCIMLSGANVAQENLDRWFYWDFDAIPIFLTLNFIIVTAAVLVLSKFSIIPSAVKDFNSFLILTLMGFILFISGTLTITFNYLFIIPGAAYMGLFLAVWLVFSIPVKLDQKGNKNVPGKKQQLLYLSSSILLTGAAAVVGYILDDPISSTAAVIYLPFLLVTLIFPVHLRHIQRARIYGIFIPSMLLATRFPLFLLPLAVIFWGLRFYYYFRRDLIYPSFKIDLD